MKSTKIRDSVKISLFLMNLFAMWELQWQRNVRRPLSAGAPSLCRWPSLAPMPPAPIHKSKIMRRYPALSMQELLGPPNLTPACPSVGQASIA